MVSSATEKRGSKTASPTLLPGGVLRTRQSDIPPRIFIPDGNDVGTRPWVGLILGDSGHPSARLGV
jgi:hypothetical protein